jgi:hypothetical protein
VAKFPGSFEIWSHYVQSLIACGSFRLATETLNTVPPCSERERGRVSILQGSLAAEQWDLNAAYAHYVEGLRLNSVDPWHNETAARIALLRGDVETAREHLKFAVWCNVRHRSLHRGAAKMSQTDRVATKRASGRTD